MNIQEMREKTEKFFDNNAKTVYQGAEGGKGMKNNTLYCNTCEHKDICGTYCVKDYKPPCDSKSSFRGNQGQTIQIADLTRIADALEKIGKELEKMNRLKALSFRETYVELDEVDEIMEG